MVDKEGIFTNVFSTGAGGSVFEFSVQTAFVITAMLNGRVPSLPIGRINSIRLQAKTATDDFVIDMTTVDKRYSCKLLAQVKSTVTFTEKNQNFIDVVSSFWEDYNDTLNFQTERDKLLLIIGESNNKLRNHIYPVLDWAKAKQNWGEFSEELKTGVEKQAIYDTFKKVILTIEADSQRIEDETIWKFLRCIDVVDYDFRSDASTHLIYLKSMIDLAKRQDVSATSDEIWGAIYTHISKKNSQGATLTIEQLHRDFNYFEKSFQISDSLAIQKLQNESHFLFNRLKNTIGNVHIERKKVYEEIIPIFNDCQVLVLSGDAGVGKSAFAKELLLGLQNVHIIAFAADQFHRPRLSSTFYELGITEDISQIFSRMALMKNQIIYIDSLEKLAEGSANAFMELVSILKKNNHIKLIATCRDYVLQPIMYEFFDDLKTRTHRIPNFSQDELNTVAELCPELKQILSNERLKMLLNRPKYLEFAQRLVNNTDLDLNDIDEITFLNELWNKIVKDEVLQIGNMHERRAKTFIEVAVRRAKKMTLFTEALDLDNDALYALQRDSILVKQNEFYAPTHDILEDWALIRYVVDIHKNHENSQDFFFSLGTTPALRRGFRLWLEFEILRSEQHAYNFVQNTLFDKQIASHWQDEIIIAILNSNFCTKFFDDNTELLVSNNSILFSRFIHLLRVSCKDVNEFPIGNGWDAVIEFVHKHLKKLTSIQSLILGALFDWEKKLDSSTLDLPPNSERVGQIAFGLLIQLKENYNGHFNRNQNTKQIESLIKFVFRLTEVVQKEVEQLLLEAFTSRKEENQMNWRAIEFNEKVIEFSLSGLYSGTTSLFFPELIIEIAKESWQKKENSENNSNQVRFGSRSSLDVDHHFGLKRMNSNYMPASASQTFVSQLLLHHPTIAMRFIVEFINRATKIYVNSSFGQDDEPKEIMIFVDGELVSKQWGSFVLWLMYRGKGRTTPYLLQSILKALEHYLFQLGINCTDSEVITFQNHVEFLVKSSNSVSITSVLASILMACPKSFGEKMFYFVTNFDFLDWDSSRWKHDQSEHGYFLPLNMEDEIFNAENQNADKWEHRKKFEYGLRQFIIYYQINIKDLNNQLYNEFDFLNSNRSEKDTSWRKTFSEIDIRNWEAQEYDKELGGFKLLPKYDEDVQEKVSAYSENQKEIDRSAEFSHWTRSVCSGENVNPLFVTWSECYSYYKTKESISHGSIDKMFDNPGILACIGIKNFRNLLSSDQVNWCFSKITSIITAILKDHDHKRLDLYSYSLFDKEPVLAFLPEITQDKFLLSSSINKVQVLIFSLLFSMEDKNEKTVLINSIKSNLWVKDNDFANVCFFALIEYSKFAKTLESKAFLNHSDRKLHIEQFEQELLNRASSSEIQSFLDFSEITFTNHSYWYLDSAIQIIPTHLDIKFAIPFLSSIYKIFIVEHGSSDQNYLSERFELGISLKKVIAEFFINQPIERSREILDTIFQTFETHSSTNVCYEFSIDIFKEVILLVDRNWNEENGKQIVPNFWNLWAYFYQKFSESRLFGYSSIFLLNIEWKSSAEHWTPLENGLDFMVNRIQMLSDYNVNALIKLIGGIGLKSFMPQGLNWISNKAFDSKGEQIEYLDFQNTEKLVERAFRNYSKEIKSDRVLMNSYFMILEALIRIGSSKSYLIRENIILYKEIEL